MGIAVFGGLWHNVYTEAIWVQGELTILNKTFKKVSIILIICFYSAAVLFAAAYFVIENAERKESEKLTAEYEPKLKTYITENAEAFERLAAYEIEHAEPTGGEIYFSVYPIGELQKERNIVYTVIKDAIVRSDSNGSSLGVMFISRAGVKDVYIYYCPDGVGERTEKISDKMYYTSYEDSHF